MIAEAKPRRRPLGLDVIPSIYRSYWETEIGRLEAEVAALDRIRDSLDEARLLLVERLAQAVKQWDINSARMILAELERHLSYWESLTNAILQTEMEKAWEAGAEQASSVFKATGVLTVQPFIPRNMLYLSQVTAPTLIQSIRQETVLRVARAMRASVLAQESPLDFIQKLGSPVPMRKAARGEPTIKSGPFTGMYAEKRGRYISASGTFPTAFHRVEAIYRTEMGRLSSFANQQTLNEVARTNPGMQKQWSAILDWRTRPEHRAAHGQTVASDGTYVVGGERLSFPRDPKGSPGNTINCRCASLPWHPDWEKYGFSPMPKPREFVPWVWSTPGG